jgi:hypothetical protein
MNLMAQHDLRAIVSTFSVIPLDFALAVLALADASLHRVEYRR